MVSVQQNISPLETYNDIGYSATTNKSKDNFRNVLKESTSHINSAKENRIFYTDLICNHITARNIVLNFLA